MADLNNLCVYTVQTGDKWLVATNESPYFCFEADSEQAALGKASEALEFYKITQSAEQKQERLEPVTLDWHALSAKELVAA